MTLPAKKVLIFFYFCTKTYIVGIHMLCADALLIHVSTDNICFRVEIGKIIDRYPLIPGTVYSCHIVLNTSCSEVNLILNSWVLMLVTLQHVMKMSSYFSDSVENGDKLVETAMNAFGRIGVCTSIFVMFSLYHPL